jgi:hypothetical protein
MAMDNPFRKGFSNQNANSMGFPTSGESATGASTKQAMPAQRMQNPYEHTRAAPQNPMAPTTQPVLGAQTAQGAQYTLKPTELTPQVAGILRSQSVMQNTIAQQQARNGESQRTSMPPLPQGGAPVHAAGAEQNAPAPGSDYTPGGSGAGPQNPYKPPVPPPETPAPGSSQSPGTPPTPPAVPPGTVPPPAAPNAGAPGGQPTEPTTATPAQIAASQAQANPVQDYTPATPATPQTSATAPTIPGAAPSVPGDRPWGATAEGAKTVNPFDGKPPGMSDEQWKFQQDSKALLDKVSKAFEEGGEVDKGQVFAMNKNFAMQQAQIEKMMAEGGYGYGGGGNPALLQAALDQSNALVEQKGKLGEARSNAMFQVGQALQQWFSSQGNQEMQAWTKKFEAQGRKLQIFSTIMQDSRLAGKVIGTPEYNKIIKELWKELYPEGEENDPLITSITGTPAAATKPVEPVGDGKTGKMSPEYEATVKGIMDAFKAKDFPKMTQWAAKMAGKGTDINHFIYNDPQFKELVAKLTPQYKAQLFKAMGV